MEARADAESIRRLEHALKQGLGRIPVVAITGPRASSSTETFFLIKKYMAQVERADKRETLTLWVHQGGPPVEFKWKPEELNIGMMSLYSGSLASQRAFEKYLITVSSGPFSAL